jgi:hypothetical protein
MGDTVFNARSIMLPLSARHRVEPGATWRIAADVQHEIEIIGDREWLRVAAVDSDTGADASRSAEVTLIEFGIRRVFTNTPAWHSIQPVDGIYIAGTRFTVEGRNTSDRPIDVLGYVSGYDARPQSVRRSRLSVHELNSCFEPGAEDPDDPAEDDRPMCAWCGEGRACWRWVGGDISDDSDPADVCGRCRILRIAAGDSGLDERQGIGADLAEMTIRAWLRVEILDEIDHGCPAGTTCPVCLPLRQAARALLAAWREYDREDASAFEASDVERIERRQVYG